MSQNRTKQQVAEIKDAIRDRYPAEGAKLLAKEFGCRDDYIRSQANLIGVKRVEGYRGEGLTYAQLRKLMKEIRLENIKLIAENRRLRKGE